MGFPDASAEEFITDGVLSCTGAGINELFGIVTSGPATWNKYQINAVSVKPHQSTMNEKKPKHRIDIN